MRGPSGVVALVLAETAVGGTAVLWLGGFWGHVKRGFFILTTSVTAGCALLATTSSASGLGPTAGSAGDLGVILTGVSAIALGTSLCALILRWSTLGRILGFLGAASGAAGLVSLARVVTPSFPVAIIQLLAGAAFMGAVMVGLLLGHWYLTDRRLSREHIRRLAVVLLAAVGIEIGAVLLAGFGGVESAPGFSPFLSIGGIATWLALGMVGATAAAPARENTYAAMRSSISR